MKKLALLLLVSIFAGAITLTGYKYFIEPRPSNVQFPVTSNDSLNAETSQNAGHDQATTTFVSHDSGYTPIGNVDFTEAAEKTIHAVVHVKNLRVTDAPSNITEYLMGMRAGKMVRGMGSGVIITPDGYIVTNNHVIEGANELEVTLSNNQTYKAKVIGADKQEDVALIKIDAQNLDYLPFGNSDKTKVGQWVLAVGNPFNLTSTVTAGIISAKGRNLSEGNTKLQSFIQTDAAINPGNSGGALVNSNGELIGINAAITSKTGTYMGYSFAIPSNNARKIVEDLMEYGDVKHAILGISGGTINPDQAQKMGYALSQGVYVASASEGARAAGLKAGDLITAADGKPIYQMSDLTAYIGTKRPGDKIAITYNRDKKEKTAQVKLTEYETYILDVADLELVNADQEYLKSFHADKGVRIAQATSRYLEIPQDRYIIVAIDGQPVGSIQEVREIVNNKNGYDRTQITFQNRKGQRETLRF